MVMLPMKKVSEEFKRRFNNQCTERSIEVKLSALLGNLADQPTDPTNRPTDILRLRLRIINHM